MIKITLFSLLTWLTLLNAAPDGDYIFQLESATQAEIDVNMGGVPKIGMMIYNTDTNTLWYYNGTTWVDSFSASTGVDKIDDLTDGKSNNFSVFLGKSSGNANSTNYNVGVGIESFYNNVSGVNGVALGYQAGFNAGGNGNIFLGYRAGFNETTSNKLYIENQITDASTSLIYGEFGVDASTTGNILRTNSEFQIGNPSTTGYKFPIARGTNGEVLVTDGSGALSWEVPGTTVSTDADNQIQVGSDGGAYLGPTVYTGSFIINSNGSQNITGLPFQPSQITFVAHANVEALDVDAGSSNSDTRVNLFWGSMNGFIRKNAGGSTTQQVIFIGQSGRETGSLYINNISKYASSSNCIGVRYANESGNKIGMLTASFSSFNSDGFTINVTRNNDATSENLVVLYTAYK